MNYIIIIINNFFMEKTYPLFFEEFPEMIEVLDTYS